MHSFDISDITIDHVISLNEAFANSREDYPALTKLSDAIINFGDEAEDYYLKQSNASIWTSAFVRSKGNLYNGDAFLENLKSDLEKLSPRYELCERGENIRRR